MFNHDVCGGTPADITPSLTVTSLSDIPPFLFVSEADGLSLKVTPAATLTFAFDNHNFALLSGTSIATPHAVGVTRWVWNGRQRIRAEKPAFDSSVAITQAHT